MWRWPAGVRKGLGLEILQEQPRARGEAAAAEAAAEEHGHPRELSAHNANAHQHGRRGIRAERHGVCAADPCRV